MIYVPKRLRIARRLQHAKNPRVKLSGTPSTPANRFCDHSRRAKLTFLRQIAGGKNVSRQLVQLNVDAFEDERQSRVIGADRLNVFHEGAVVGCPGAVGVRNGILIRIRVTTQERLVRSRIRDLGTRPVRSMSSSGIMAARSAGFFQFQVS